MARKSKGRQKIEMVKIRNESNLMVTYSKRRSGLFKKASELVTLCGAEVAIIVFSPGRKAYSFGHPSVDRVVDRYLTGAVPQNSTAVQLLDAHGNARTHELNMHLTQVLNEVEMEKKHGEELDRISRESQSQCWWESPLDGMNLAQLDQLKAALQELRQNVTNQAEQLVLLNVSQSQQNFAPNAYLEASNAAAFAPAPNALPPAPNAGVLPYDQTAAGMFNTNVVPYGYNFRYGNNGFF